MIDCFLRTRARTPLRVTIFIPSHKYKDVRSRLFCRHIELLINNNWFQFKLLNLSYKQKSSDILNTHDFDREYLRDVLIRHRFLIKQIQHQKTTKENLIYQAFVHLTDNQVCLDCRCHKPDNWKRAERC